MSEAFGALHADLSAKVAKFQEDMGSAARTVRVMKGTLEDVKVAGSNANKGFGQARQGAVNLGGSIKSSVNEFRELGQVIGLAGGPIAKFGGIVANLATTGFNPLSLAITGVSFAIGALLSDSEEAFKKKVPEHVAVTVSKIEELKTKIGELAVKNRALREGIEPEVEELQRLRRELTKDEETIRSLLKLLESGELSFVEEARTKKEIEALRTANDEMRKRVQLLSYLAELNRSNAQLQEKPRVEKVPAARPPAPGAVPEDPRRRPTKQEEADALAALLREEKARVHGFISDANAAAAAEKLRSEATDLGNEILDRRAAIERELAEISEGAAQPRLKALEDAQAAATFADGFRARAATTRAELESVSATGEMTYTSLQDGFADVFVTMESGFKNAGKVALDVLSNIEQQFLRLAANQIFSSLTASFMPSGPTPKPAATPAPGSNIGFVGGKSLSIETSAPQVSGASFAKSAVAGDAGGRGVRVEYHTHVEKDMTVERREERTPDGMAIHTFVRRAVLEDLSSNGDISKELERRCLRRGGRARG